ncbi:MAG: HEAT repeat domain-containing protein, partial [bacterium]
MLEKNAEIDAFNVVDLSKNPELAEVNNVRSVPWLKLGDDIELTGAHTIEELRQWLTSGQNEMTEALRFGQLFQNGGLDQVINEVRASPSKIHDVLK